MRRIVFASLALLASVSCTPETPKSGQVESNAFQRWVDEQSDDITLSYEPRTQHCNSVVDCRRIGHDLASIQLNGRDFTEVSQYPSPEREWDRKKGGYVLKTFGNVKK